MSLPVDALLREVAPDSPCGPDLEYDGAFQAMIAASKGKPAQEFGDTVIPAVDPDWREVKSQALDLAARTKDVRVLVHLLPAAIRLEGWGELGDCMALLQGYLDRYWDHVHPELDPEDSDDPTMRFNALLGLCDGEGLLRSLREAPLVESRGLGRFSLRDVQVANGTTSPVGEGDSPNLQTIEAAFMDADLPDLRGVGDSIDQAIQRFDLIEAGLAQRVGAAMTPNLGPFRELVVEVQQVMHEQLARRGVGVEPEPGAAGGEGAAGGPGAAQPSVSGAVNTPEDVIRVIDKVCDYYRRNEPSSPVPLLLRRAKRLVNKSFLEILEDMAPGGMHEAQTIGGVDSDES